MNCPHCQTAVPEGAFICDACDHILDDSFLGEGGDDSDVVNHSDDATRLNFDAAPSVEDDATRIGPADASSIEEGATAIRPPVSQRPARIAAPRVPAETDSGATLPATSSGDLFDDDDDEETAAAAGPRLDDAAALHWETSAAIDDIKTQFTRLPRSEKITAVGGTLLMFSLALPWQNTRDAGDQIGLASGGWPVALFTAVALLAVFFRRHPVLKPHRGPVVLAGLTCAAIALGSCILYLRGALVLETVRAGGRLFERAISTPAFGVYVGLFAATIMLGGSLKTMMDRERLP